MIGDSDFKTVVVMKNLKSILFVAAAAMTLASCGVKEITPEVKPEGRIVYFGTEVNDLTKASLTTEDDVNFVANWENNDALEVAGFDRGSYIASFPAVWDSEKDAFAASGDVEYFFDEPYDFIGVYPQPEEGVIDFGSARTQDGNNYAGKYDVMLSEATSLTLVEGETFVLPMDRQTAIAYFHLTSTLSEDEKIVSATLSVNENLAGSFIYDEGEIAPDATANSITLSFTNAPSIKDLRLWFNIFPGEYTGLKLEVETEKHTLTIQNPNTVTYEQGKLYKVAADATAKYTFKGGEYVFTAINESDHYIMPAYTTGNNIKALAYTLNGEDKIVVNEEYDAADCIYTVTRVTEGEYAGLYTIQDANGLYIYPNSDQKNQLVADDKLNSSAYYWNINGNDVISQFNGNNCMRFNYNNGTPLFSCYANNTKQSPIAIESASIVIYQTPKIKLSGNTLSVDSDGTLKDEITVTPNRYCGDISFNVSYTDGEGWISDAAIVDGKLSMTVNANEGTERVATVTLSATGAKSQSVTVTQAAYVPGGDTVEGTITFGSADGSLNVNSANVSGKDNNDIQWTVATVGTTSFTANNGYAQIGSSNKPATSITFTATIPSGKEVTDFEAKFGGFSATAGSVKLYVDDVEVGSGSLNESNDVTVTASNVPAAGTNLKVTVTGIAKGVKVYYITYAYGNDNKTPQSLSFDATIGTWDLYTNTGNLPTLDASGAHTTVEYSSSDETVATVNSSTGAITAKKTGTTTITATASGDATYKKATASYILTITDSTPILTLKKENVNVNASAVNDAKIEAAYELAYATDSDVVVTKDGNITSASISSGTVTYSISANEDKDNTAISHIYLTLNGNKKTITITQAKNVTLPNGFEVTSYASVPAGWTASNTSNITKYSGYFFLGGGDTLTSCTCDLSSFSTATISVSVRTYGTCSAKSIDISYSTDGGTNWANSTIIISTSYATKQVTINNPSSNVIVKFKSNESTNGVGARLQTLKLTGN